MKRILHDLFGIVFFIGCGSLVALEALESLDKDMSANNWSEPRDIILPSEKGTIKATVQTYEFHWKNGKGEDEQNLAKLVVIPSKGLAWVGRAIYENFFAFDDKIIGVFPLQGNELFINESTIRDLAIDEKSRAGKNLAVKKAIVNLCADPIHLDRRISLNEILGRRPFERREDVRPSPPPKVTNISFKKSNVVIALEGANASKAFITFNRNMDPLAATLDDKQVFVKSVEESK